MNRKRLPCSRVHENSIRLDRYEEDKDKDEELIVNVVPPGSSSSSASEDSRSPPKKPPKRRNVEAYHLPTQRSTRVRKMREVDAIEVNQYTGKVPKKKKGKSSGIISDTTLKG